MYAPILLVPLLLAQPAPSSQPAPTSQPAAIEAAAPPAVKPPGVLQVRVTGESMSLLVAGKPHDCGGQPTCADVATLKATLEKLKADPAWAGADAIEIRADKVTRYQQVVALLGALKPLFRQVRFTTGQ